MDILYGYLLSYSYLTIVIVLAMFLNSFFKIRNEYTRKFIHIFVCFSWIIMNRYFGNTIHSVIVPLSFVLINLLSYKFNIIKAMETDKESDKSLGTVYYVLSMAVMNLFCIYSTDFTYYAGMGIFALSFGDGFAAVIGRKIKFKNFDIVKGKSLWGTLSCVAFTAVGLYIFKFYTNMHLSFISVVILSALTAILELISGKYDNLFIPFAIMILGKVIC